VCRRASSLLHQEMIPPSHIPNQVTTHVSLMSFPLPRLISYGKRDFQTIFDGEDLCLVKVALHDARRVTNNTKTTQA